MQACERSTGQLKLSRVQVATLFSGWSGPSSALAKLTVRHVWYVSLHVVLKLCLFAAQPITQTAVVAVAFRALFSRLGTRETGSENDRALGDLGDA